MNRRSSWVPSPTGDEDAIYSPATLPAWSAHRTGDPISPQVVAAIVHVVIGVLSAQSATASPPSDGPPPMLTVTQTAALMGMSRMTVIRKADAGELPCVIISRSPRRTMRRFPRALIEDLAAHGGCGMHIELSDYTAHWLASVADRVTPTA